MTIEHAAPYSGSTGSGARAALAPWLPPRTARVRSRPVREMTRAAPVSRPVTVAVQVTVTGADAVTVGAEIADRFRALAAAVAEHSGAADATVDAALVLAGDQPALAGVAAPAGDARLRIEPAQRAVLVDGEPVDFTRREFDLLLYLAHQPSRVFTRHQLLQAVWGYEHLGGERTVDVHVRRVRVKLGAQESLVKTVRGIGYRFAGPGLADIAE